MSEPVECLKCSDVMFWRVEYVPGRWSKDPDKPGHDLDHQHEGGDDYFVCPHCGAKNVLVCQPTPEGAPGRFRISHLKE